MLQALIGRDGTVRELHLMDGYFVLGRAASQAVKQWHFRPYVVNGRALETQTILTRKFPAPGLCRGVPQPGQSYNSLFLVVDGEVKNPILSLRSSTGQGGVFRLPHQPPKTSYWDSPGCGMPDTPGSRKFTVRMVCVSSARPFTT